jgi:hypothetical protein
MEMTRLLLTQSEIRNNIRDVFADRRQRRIAIVAFVGKGADAYTGDPDGLLVVCWPRAGGTNPEAVWDLQCKGAKVYFAPRLHMKLYWSPRGAVVGSANLSTNALGAGDLRELAVRIPGAQVPIDDIWKRVKPRPVTRASLEKLRREHAAYQRKNGRGAGTKPRSFADWAAEKGRKPWRLAWWNDGGQASKRAKALSERMGSAGQVADYIACRKGELRPDTWLLTARRSVQGFLTQPQWLYVQGVVLVDKKEKRTYVPGWPCQAVQVHPLRMCPAPPFAIDKAFRQALGGWRREAGLQAFEDAVIREAAVPITKTLANALNRHYRAAARV